MAGVIASGGSTARGHVCIVVMGTYMYVYVCIVVMGTYVNACIVVVSAYMYSGGEYIYI